jgi:hypothetical protein
MGCGKAGGAGADDENGLVHCRLAIGMKPGPDVIIRRGS